MEKLWECIYLYAQQRSTSELLLFHTSSSSKLIPAQEQPSGTISSAPLIYREPLLGSVPKYLYTMASQDEASDPAMEWSMGSFASDVLWRPSPVFTSTGLLPSLSWHGIYEVLFWLYSHQPVVSDRTNGGGIVRCTTSPCSSRENIDAPERIP